MLDIIGHNLVTEIVINPRRGTSSRTKSRGKLHEKLAHFFIPPFPYIIEVPWIRTQQKRALIIVV